MLQPKRLFLISVLILLVSSVASVALAQGTPARTAASESPAVAPATPSPSPLPTGTPASNEQIIEELRLMRARIAELEGQLKARSANSSVGDAASPTNKQPEVATAAVANPTAPNAELARAQPQGAVTPDQDQSNQSEKNKVKLEIGGTLVADFYYNTARPVGPGVPMYLAPASPFGLNQHTFDANARATMLSARLYGPKIGSFEFSARAQVFLFDPVVINDKYGILPFAAVAELKNDKWLFNAGLQLQIFNPMMPNTLAWGKLGGSGNTGAGVIGQARVERYFHTSENSQVTLTGGISEPITTTFSDDVVGSEDNGWPNVEGRAALALGPLQGRGLTAKRPFEVSISGVVGQIRTTSAGGNRVVTDMWGLGSEIRYAVTPRTGFLGEVFTGRSLGVWTGGILQTKNPSTFEGIHASGGWLEGYYYFLPDKLHTHLGFGIDDPRNSDLAPGQKTYNRTYFGNLVWEVSQQYRLGVELTHRKTDFKHLPDPLLSLDNQGFGIQLHAAYKFGKTIQ